MLHLVIEKAHERTTSIGSPKSLYLKKGQNNVVNKQCLQNQHYFLHLFNDVFKASIDLFVPSILQNKRNRASILVPNSVHATILDSVLEEVVLLLPAQLMLLTMEW